MHFAHGNMTGVTIRKSREKQQESNRFLLEAAQPCSLIACGGSTQLVAPARNEAKHVVPTGVQCAYQHSQSHQLAQAGNKALGQMQAAPVASSTSPLRSMRMKIS